MDYVNPQALVSSEQLSKIIENDDVVILDGSYHLPNINRNADKEFKLKHINGACFFDIDIVCDAESDLPHMLPSQEHFAEAAGGCGISNETHVVIYDVYGMQSAARVWWMFRVFGHDKVSVLDGGLPKWEKDGGKVSSKFTPPLSKIFVPSFRPGFVRNLSDIFDLLDTKNGIIIDARSSGRFSGTEPEPRDGMRSGHMPDAINMPFSNFLSPKDKTFLPATELQKQFSDSSLIMEEPIVTTCGSGVTACIIALALFLLGKEDVSVYDGSWSEWGALNNTPITK